MVFRTGILLMLALWLSACASVESFRKMTPAQRAREVCTGIDSYTALEREEREHARKAAEIRQVLDRGYRLHESCRTVEASKAPEIVCPSSAAPRPAIASAVPSMPQCAIMTKSLFSKLSSRQCNPFSQRYNPRY